MSRNYQTPGRLASVAATKTEPGAPRARKIEKEPTAPIAREPERDDGPANPIQWRPESEVDADPALPPDDTPLREHAQSAEKLTAAITYFREAGFWPNTVSALVKLRREDCDRLVPPPSYQLKNQKPCKLRPAAKAKSPKKSCANGAKKIQTPTPKHTTPLTRRRSK